MAGVIIQFHATIDELEQFVGDAISQYGIFATALWFHPFRATVLPQQAVSTIRHSAVRDVAFTTLEPRLDAAHLLDWVDKNEGALMLGIGKISNTGLDESCLSSKTDDQDKLGVWRKVAADLRKRTKAGASAVNRATGATSFLRNHRYSIGAKRLSEDGVPILPVGRGSLLRL